MSTFTTVLRRADENQGVCEGGDESEGAVVSLDAC